MQKMEMQHHRLMEKIGEQAQTDAKAQQTSGAFNEMSMMHQYMGQDGSSFPAGLRFVEGRAGR